jgi:hypothetical protein
VVDELNFGKWYGKPWVEQHQQGVHLWVRLDVDKASSQRPLSVILGTECAFFYRLDVIAAGRVATFKSSSDLVWINVKCP